MPALSPTLDELAATPLPQPRPNLLEQARQQFPVLRNYPIGYVENINEKDPRFLEAWFPGSKGWDWKGKWYDRPAVLPLDQYGIEVIKRGTKASDVAADIASHFLVDADPRVKQAYSNFLESTKTPEWQKRLRTDYDYTVRHEGETMPRDEWINKVRLPAYFRGYAFQQWPKSFTDRVFSPAQRANFDAMLQYMRGQ